MPRGGRPPPLTLGAPDDYKPCIALLPNGEWLLTAFHQDKKDGNKVLEQNLLFRSKDGGRTWSNPEKLDLFAKAHAVVAFAHGCNCQGSTGAGIAVGFRGYPEMYERYRAF